MAIVSNDSHEVFARLDRAFDIRTLIGGKLLHQALELRRQVYCTELGYEGAKNGIETDQYDDHSLHAVVLERDRGEAVATVRLVRPQNGAFPLEAIPGAALADFLPRMETAEISRFAISKERRGKASIDGFLRLCLFRGIVSMSRAHQVKYWCAVMEPGLIRMLKLSGVHFYEMGTPVEHRGTRQPVWGRVKDVLDRMEVEKPSIWTYVTEEILYIPRLLEPTRY